MASWEIPGLGSDGDNRFLPGLARPRVVLPVATAVVVTVAALSAVAGVGPLATSGGGPVLGNADTDQQRPAVVSVSGNRTVTVEYVLESGDTERFVVDGVRPELSDEEHGWAIVDREELPPVLERAGDPQARGSAEPDRSDADVAAGAVDAGVVTFGQYALVGEISASTRRAGDSSVTVVVPAGRDVDPARKSYFLSEYVSPYALGAGGSDVTIVAVPDALSHRGLMYGDDAGYVTVDWFWDGGIGSVWIHEYVHARQEFTTACEMTWFRESSAEYLSFRIMEEQHPDLTDREVRERLDSLPEHREVSLANCSRETARNVDYTRGVRLLYAVDAAIRTGSDGEHTLFDVFRAMNGREEPVTVEEFRRLVERYSGEDQPWIDPAVADPGEMDRYRGYEGAFSGE
ncbi:MAG: hypothetical protein V5A46_07270 [Haloferacaceae archaeon]